MADDDEQLAEEERQRYAFQVFPIERLSAHVYAPDVPDFGVWHLTLNEAATLIVLDLWMTGEQLEFEEVTDCEGIDDPRLKEALEPEIVKYEKKMINAINEGRLPVSFMRRDSEDRLIAAETYIHCHELFKWLSIRQTLPSIIFAEWIDTEGVIATEVKNEIKYLRAIESKGKGAVRKLSDRRLLAKYRESVPDDFEKLHEMYRYEVRENARLRDVLVTLRSGKTEPVDRPLGTRARRTLLTVIAALCGKLDIHPENRDAARKITEITEGAGTRISNDTIKTMLTEIPGAVENRMKDST
jgi:hypothetical protein